MDIRYSVHPRDFRRATTEEMRREFLIKDLYQPDRLTAVYSHVDRMVTLGCMPVKETIAIDAGLDIRASFGTDYFLERREIGIFNIGGSGRIEADGVSYEMGYKDCLYIAKGTKAVRFQSESDKQPAKFYMVSAPAHRAYETVWIPQAKARKSPAGDAAHGNRRTIHQYIHPDVLPTCQLLMGLTALETGNVWNTMPCHTHERRMEIYTYFELSGEDVVFHMMGEPTETRHLVLRNEQAVISPSWSIHSGCATASYSFIWAMGGENQCFDDMDHIPVNTMG